MFEEIDRILIVDDDRDIAGMLNAYFSVQGYHVSSVHRGRDAVSACLDTPPNLIILDIRLPDIDGYDVARQLRTNRRTAHIPIIFLTNKSDRSDRLQGLELGADDFINKPFDVQELRLRVRNALQRARQDNLTNPVTGLPDASLVEEKIDECLSRTGWTMLLVALENLDSYREVYSFVACDDVLRAVSLMVQNTIKVAGGADDFLGHLGEAEFLVITNPERSTTLQERIRSQLEQSLDYFYPIRDRKNPSARGKRIGVRIGLLQAQDGPFPSLEAIKQALLVNKR